jgi:CRP/FNR family transcriptional regulator, cyclic AMP receptor protein
MSATAEVLAEVPLFADLDPTDRAVLAERIDIVTIEEGEVLFDYGEPGDWMGIVLRGAVEMTVKTKTGESVFLELAESNDFFGEISLLDGGSRSAKATCTTTGEMIVVDRGDLDELLRIKPAAAMSLLKATGKRLRANAQVLRNTASKNSYEVAKEQLNVIQQAADWVANFSGSLTFLIIHIIGFSIYILLNVGLFTFGNFDAFPFGLLTMVVSLEAIILSTLLLYSSNRQAARDRVRADIEYDVNLKAELQIQHLHEKIDQIHAQILGRLDALDPKRRPPGATGLPHDLSG